MKYGNKVKTLKAVKTILKKIEESIRKRQGGRRATAGLSVSYKSGVRWHFAGEV